MDSAATRRDDPAWFVIDVPGLACPGTLLQGPRGWRVRLCATEVDDGLFAFFGEPSMEPAVVGVTFGDFRSSGAAIEFVAGVAAAGAGVAADLAGRVREALPDEEPDRVPRDFFLLLEEGADPVTGARAAVVLLFEVESPSFDGDVQRAIESARAIPVRSDPAPADFYDRAASVPSPSTRSPAGLPAGPVQGGLPAAVAAVGGIGALMSMSPDESMRYVPPATRFGAEDPDALPEDPDVDDDRWSPPPPYDVRPMGVLARDMGEAVARVASPMSSKGTMKLKVDESVDEGVRDDGVTRRSYSVFTVMRMGDLHNARLRSALTGIFKEEAGKQRAS